MGAGLCCHEKKKHVRWDVGSFPAYRIHRIPPSCPNGSEHILKGYDGVRPAPALAADEEGIAG